MQLQRLAPLHQLRQRQPHPLRTLGGRELGAGVQRAGIRLDIPRRGHAVHLARLSVPRRAAPRRERLPQADVHHLQPRRRRPPVGEAPLHRPRLHHRRGRPRGQRGPGGLRVHPRHRRGQHRAAALLARVCEDALLHARGPAPRLPLRGLGGARGQLLPRALGRGEHCRAVQAAGQLEEIQSL